MPARLHSTLRRIAKRMLAPFTRALHWRVELLVEAEVARRVDAAVQQMVAARIAEVNERIAPALNQLISTNAVLRGSGRAVADVAGRAAELEQRMGELESRIVALERTLGPRLTLTSEKPAADEQETSSAGSARVEGTRR